MEPTEKDFEAATIATAEKQNWHFGRDERGNILWLSEGSLALACVKAGYALATPPAPASDALLSELERKLGKITDALPWWHENDSDDNRLIYGGQREEVATMPWFMSDETQPNADFIVAICNAAPALLARVRASEALSDGGRAEFLEAQATYQGALDSATETNRVLANRLKAAADALPTLIEELADAVGEADAEYGGTGDGYEQCYNAADNVASKLRALGRVLDGKEQPHA